MKIKIPYHNTPRIIEYEFKTNLGRVNFVFIGSSTEMFAEDMHSQWTTAVLDILIL